MPILWNAEQLRVLGTMDTEIDYLGEMSDDQLSELYNIVPDYLEFDRVTGEPINDCLVVESILDTLADMMEPRGLISPRPKEG